MPTKLTIGSIALVEPLYYEIHRAPQLTDDQTDYLCTPNILTVTGTYNPQTNAFILKNAAPASALGTFPASTYAAIRHQLEQPRQTVTLNDGKVDIFSVAGPDARNGPVVKVHDIQEVMGVSTYVISLSVLVYMNEAALFKGGAANTSAILSHRYKAYDDFDEDTYLTRTIRGYAEFRSDRLAALTAVPDQFRAYLWHPTPPGMKLDAAHVEVDSDGLTLDYTLVFRQKPIIVTAPGCTRIECFDSFTLSRKNAGDMIFGVAQGLASLSATSVLSAGISAVAPSFLRRCHARVWGYPNVSKSYLQMVAYRLAINRMGGDTSNLNTFTVSQDLLGRYVEVIAERAIGGIAGSVGALYGGQTEVDKETKKALDVFTAGQPAGDENPFSPKVNDCKNVGTANGVAILTDTVASPTAAGPYLLNDSLVEIKPAQGCRGTYLGQLVMAALLGQDATPPQPNLPALVKPQRSLRPIGATFTPAPAN